MDFVDFSVYLMSGRFATISCLCTETLENLQQQICAELDLKSVHGDAIPLLSFFQSGFSTHLLHLNTMARELQGCSIQVLQEAHPEWCRGKCFLNQSQSLDWDVEEEVIEWIALFSDGHFRYLRRRSFWTRTTSEATGPEAIDHEELEGVGRWDGA